MKVIAIPMEINALGTIPKDLMMGLKQLEIGGGAETIKTAALLRSARILKRVLKTQGDFRSPRFQCKSIS